MSNGIPVVHLDWHGDLPTFHCPVCGHPLWTENGGSETPCEHILFTFIGEVGELDIHNKDLERHLLVWGKNDAEEKGLEWDENDPDLSDYLSTQRELDIVEMFEELAIAIDSSSAACFVLTSCWVSCGPMAFTVVVAVDFARKMTEEPD